MSFQEPFFALFKIVSLWFFTVESKRRRSQLFGQLATPNARTRSRTGSAHMQIFILYFSMHFNGKYLFLKKSPKALEQSHRSSTPQSSFTLYITALLIYSWKWNTSVCIISAILWGMDWQLLQIKLYFHWKTINENFLRK